MRAKTRKLRTASWSLLTFLGSAVLYFSFVSAWLAYSGADYPIAGEPVAQVAGGRSEVEAGLRAVRGTSAAYGAAFAILVISIAVGPYRQGTRSSWWAVLSATLVLLGIVLTRLPTLGTPAGVSAASKLCGLLLLALLLDIGRLRSPAP